ncbi:MAG: nitrogen fixation protein NifQ [Azonexus sp.]|nr:nitrogen fixation protein NifQ [Azonexus sp.]MCK6412806.1 nitrogen fixation protein NifQ [Azonexus sp.]
MRPGLSPPLAERGFSASISPAGIAANFQRPPLPLLRNIVAHVRQSSEEGDLPLFAWTLGLPRESLLRMQEECRLPGAALEAMDGREYERIERLVPSSFHDLRRLFFEHRTRLIDIVHSDYLSRALAAACFGSRPLWADLGLRDDKELNSFIATFFIPLAIRHKQCRHWKRQLLSDLHHLSHGGFSISDLLLQCVLLRQ